MKPIGFVLAAMIFPALVPAAAAQSYGGHYPTPRGEVSTVHPNRNNYGPGVYAEGGYSIYVPRHCYASREQVLVGGKLVWRPLVVCTHGHDW